MHAHTPRPLLSSAATVSVLTNGLGRTSPVEHVQVGLPNQDGFSSKKSGQEVDASIIKEQLRTDEEEGG